MSGPITRKNILVFSRWFFSSAIEEEIDFKGRVKISKYLTDFAEIDKDIILVGVSERIEIWSKEMWKKYYNLAESMFTGDENSFEELGF